MVFQKKNNIFEIVVLLFQFYKHSEYENIM